MNFFGAWQAFLRAFSNFLLLFQNRQKMRGSRIILSGIK